jgi:hypothetical protein
MLSSLQNQANSSSANSSTGSTDSGTSDQNLINALESMATTGGSA